MNKQGIITAKNFAGKLIRLGMERVPGSDQPQIRIRIDQEYIYVPEADFSKLVYWLFSDSDQPEPKHAKGGFYGR